MENLFSDDPQFRRVQYKKLSDNVREWQQEISALIEERLPRDLGLAVEVVFQNVDDEKGYAVGTAIARDESGEKAIGIPIVVKAWHLAPIDLFFSENKLFPMTDDNIAKVFYQSSLGASVAPLQPPPNMADDVFADTRTPPLGGKYSYSAPFSMLNLIGGTLGAEDIALLKQAAMSNPAILAAYYRRGNLELLKKYASDTPSGDEQDRINKERSLALFTIKKDGPDAYRLWSAPDEVYDPVMVSTDRQGLKAWLNMREAKLWNTDQDPLSNLDRYGHFTLKPPESPYGVEVDGPTGNGVDGSGSYGAQLGEHKCPFVFDPLQDERIVATIDKFGRYGVRDRDGVMAKGWVIPNVVDFDGKPVSTKLFLGKAMAAIQGRIAGIPINDDFDASLQPDRPDTGKMGTLVYREGDRVLATVPFQVTGVTVFKNIRGLAIVDYHGNKMNLILSPNVNGVVKISDKDMPSMGPLLGPKDNYIVSSKMAFIRMPRLCPVSENPEEFKTMAGGLLDRQPLKVAMANGKYVFRGGAIAKYASAQQTGMMNEKIRKYAFAFNSLAKPEAEFLLRYWGLDQEKTAEVLREAPRRIQLEVHHLRFPPVPGEIKTAAASPERLALIREIKAPIDDLVKIGANLDDAQTVDSVLGLGFVNDENVARFASATPMLWEVSHMLCKLLLAARIGMEDIPEESVRAAIQHLQRVIDGLGRLKMLEEHKKVSSANPATTRFIGGRLLEAASPIGFAR